MRTLSYFCGLLLVASNFGCERVIDFDLNSADPRLVVEASLSDDENGARVVLTETVNFSDDNVFPPGTGAVVTLSENTGISEVLEEIEPGLYQGSAITGTPGSSYTLSIDYQGENYSSVNPMPMPVAIDSVYLQPTGFGNGRVVTAQFQDPPGIENWYRLFVFTNERPADNLYILRDRLQDGEMITQTLFGIPNNRLREGDTVRVVLQSISGDVFEYLRTFQQLDAVASTAPGNPLSNISNNALGYFSAHSETELTYIIPD